jgi:hypothetical protein
MVGESEGSMRLVDRRGRGAMPTDAEYESMIQKFDNWKKLRAFWSKPSPNPSSTRSLFLAKGHPPLSLPGCFG